MLIPSSLLGSGWLRKKSQVRVRSDHILVSSHKTCLMPATATLCVFLTLLPLTCLALTCRDGCCCFPLEEASPTRDLWGGSRGPEQLCAPGELCLSPQSAGKWHFQRRGRRGLGWRCGRAAWVLGESKSPAPSECALHNLVMKELPRVEPPSVRSGASLQHGRDAAACTGRVKRRQHPVKDLVFNFASHTGTDPAKSSPD